MSGLPRGYSGREAVVPYDGKRCIHAAERVRHLPAVFIPGARPWINPDGASAERLGEVIARCPTGALHLSFKDRRTAEMAPTENTATARADGPLYLRGLVTIVDVHGDILQEDTRVALCRCGASKNKPFCVGSHQRIGFKA